MDSCEGKDQDWPTSEPRFLSPKAAFTDHDAVATRTTIENSLSEWGSRSEVGQNGVEEKSISAAKAWVVQ